MFAIVNEANDVVCMTGSWDLVERVALNPSTFTGAMLAYAIKVCGLRCVYID